MALTAPAAFAATEVGDAGELPLTAQELGPPGPMPSIDGTIAGKTDRDLYRICIDSPAGFSASTVGGAGWDTQLFLLDEQGRGVYANDDSGSLQSTLPAGHALGPKTAGVYYLAISPWDFDPYSAGGAIFPTFSSGVHGPSGPGGGGAISRWATVETDTSDGGPYRITLTGTRSCVVPDTTGPEIDLDTPPEGAVYDRGQQVLADYNCSDARSGVASCSGDVPDGQAIDTTTLGTKTFTVNATDGVGNPSTKTHSYTVVDGTDPTITLTRPQQGIVYDRNEEVRANYSCADESGGSGIASCVGTVADGELIDTGSLGEHSFTVTATDKAGNTHTVTHTYRVSDFTRPTVELRTPAQGAIYELGQVVKADYSCADEQGGSGLQSCTGTLPDDATLDTSALGERSFTVIAQDAAGNRSSLTHRYTVVQGDAPAIDLRSPAEGATYDVGEEAFADYSCSDEGGSGVASCTGTVADGARIDTAGEGEKTFTVTAEDLAGNKSSVTHTYRVRRLDSAPPAIDLRSPVDGAAYALDQEVRAGYSCSDVSGVASCAGDVADGALIDTSTVGLHSFSVSAVDGRGNAVTKTVHYRVVFDFEGFFKLPRKPKAGRTIPMIFSLEGYQGREVIAAGYPRSASCGSSNETPTRSPGRTRLRYKPRRDLYVYLWKTDKRWAGTCREFILKLDDGNVHRAALRFADKRKHDDDDRDDDD